MRAGRRSGAAGRGAVRAVAIGPPGRPEAGARDAVRAAAAGRAPRAVPPLLALVPPLTLAAMLGPIAAGLLGTVLPAFGVLPALGGTTPTLEPWRDLLAAPGLPGALLASAVSGIGAAVLALAATLAIAAAWHGTRAMATLTAALPALLALPHAAFAIGFAFLVGPAGWIARIASPELTGWTRPPDLPLVGDPWGIALMLALAAKETPFLLLMLVAAVGQAEPGPALRAARALGCGPAEAWLRVVLPRVWPQMRLPFYAVLAYGLTVADMAIVLGPTAPPTLSVLILQWFDHPDLALRHRAAAGAVLQLLTVAAAVGGARLAEAAIARALRPLLWAAPRGASGRASGRAARAASGAAVGLIVAASVGALLALAVWSAAWRWRFPDALPAEWSAATWERMLPLLAGPAGTTLLVGAAASALALALVLGCLEHEDRAGVRPSDRALWLLYLPLILPQTGFLFGVQVLLVLTGTDGTLPALVWAHLLFVLPYVYLVLADPWRALDPRYARAAASLGAGPWRTFRRIKLPLLLRPVLIALKVGFAVSAALYLPTVFAGAGRLPTLATEAVAASAGADRRVVGVVAFALGALPFAGFALAILLTRGRRWAR